MLPNGALFVYGKRKLFSDKLVMLQDDERYIVHYDIILCDKNGNQMFEGDICDTPDGQGTVAFADDIGCYCVFDFENEKYYPLSKESCEYVKVIGNVIDGAPELHEHVQEELKQDEPVQDEVEQDEPESEERNEHDE